MVFVTGGAFPQRAREISARIRDPRIAKPFDLNALRTLVAAVIR
jgi:hypothetical protein